MSIVFTLDRSAGTPRAYIAVCGATGVDLGPTCDWMTGREAYGQHCDDCDALGPILRSADPEVDVAVRNAAYLLVLLGYGPVVDLNGRVPAEDFLGRVLVAEALSGPEDGYLPQATYGRMVDCGRRPGYVLERLADLRVVAEAAVSAGAGICWA